MRDLAPETGCRLIELCQVFCWATYELEAAFVGAPYGSCACNHSAGGEYRQLCMVAITTAGP